MGLVDHLLSRGLDPTKYNVVLDEISSIATFYLWDMSGRLVGYQQYNPAGTKSIRNDEKHRDLLKYFTFVGDEGDHDKKSKKKLAVWGLESFTLNHSFCFITEGIFDAVKIHNAGYQALAVVSNDPHHLRPFFRASGLTFIAICDDDAAGSRLGKHAHISFVVPKPYHDLGDMPQADVNAWLSTKISRFI